MRTTGTTTRAVVAMIVCGALAGASWTSPDQADAATILATDGRAAYRPSVPCRLTDTREVGPLAGSNLRVQVTGGCGVPATTTAVGVSITVTDTTGDGYATITPAGSPGATSTVNWAAGETRAASTV